MNYKSKYIGNEDQLMTVQESVLCQGRQKGVKMIHIENAAGLSVTVLPDRGMDIYQIRFKGKNLNFIGSCGIVAPEYYDARDLEWLKGFYCGFLTTLGLQHFGGPRGDHGLHGREAYAPADNVEIVRGAEKNGQPTVTIKGTMREAWVFGPNLRLTRSLKFYCYENKIEMCDTVENYGFTKQQYVLGYHINYGWPLLSETAEAKIAHTSVKGRDEWAKEHIDEIDVIQSPVNTWQERCYIYDMKPDKKGMTGYTIKNEAEGVSVTASYAAETFPKLCKWQYFTSGQYVMGLEPLVCEMDGPLVGDKNAPCPSLAAGQSKDHCITFTFE